MKSLTSSLPGAFLYVGVLSLMSVRLLFCVTVVSLVPEKLSGRFLALGVCS